MPVCVVRKFFQLAQYQLTFNENDLIQVASNVRPQTQPDLLAARHFTSGHFVKNSQRALWNRLFCAFAEGRPSAGLCRPCAVDAAERFRSATFRVNGLSVTRLTWLMPVVPVVATVSILQETLRDFTGPVAQFLVGRPGVFQYAAKCFAAGGEIGDKAAMVTSLSIFRLARWGSQEFTDPVQWEIVKQRAVVEYRLAGAFKAVAGELATVECEVAGSVALDRGC